MKTRSWTLPALALSALVLAACGEGVGELKSAAGDFAQEAAKAASSVVDTQTACMLAGQDEAFCGCLQTELGPELDPAHLEALGDLVKRTAGLAPAQTEAAAEGSTADPKTRDAVIKCAARAAVGGAVEGAQGEGGG